MAMLLGIDPGQTGALALLSGDSLLRVWDMPTGERLFGKGQEVNAALLADTIREAISVAALHRKDLVVLIEQVGAMPGQGVSSMFKFGESFGIVRGIVGSLYLPVHYPTPTTWKRSAGLIGKPKDASLTLAGQLWPGQRELFRRKRDSGRADAALIAKFGGIDV